jgi:hypothetical protein
MWKFIRDNLGLEQRDLRNFSLWAFVFIQQLQLTCLQFRYILGASFRYVLHHDNDRGHALLPISLS